MLFALVALLGACAKPKTIPDEKLEKIFRDIFLVNSYCNSRSINTDSLSIYEPILHEHGYRPRDLVYTLEHYSRRKSSRLSDILDRSIQLLDKQYDVYAARVGVLDTIDMIARERFRETCLKDTSLNITRLRDTSALRMKFAAREGQFRVRFSYKLDTSDHNSLRTTINILDSARNKVASRTLWMRQGEREKIDERLESPASARTFELVIGNYPQNAQTPSLRIDTFSVVRYLPLKQALDSLDRHLIDYKLLIDGKEYSRLGAPDSLTLRIHPPGVRQGRDSIP